MARFPDSRIVARVCLPRSFVYCGGIDPPLGGIDPPRVPVASDDALLAAYSGGTVWASHPLRVAAGVDVKLYERRV